MVDSARCIGCGGAPTGEGAGSLAVEPELRFFALLVLCIAPNGEAELLLGAPNGEAELPLSAPKGGAEVLLLGAPNGDVEVVLLGAPKGDAVD